MVQYQDEAGEWHDIPHHTPLTFSDPRNDVDLLPVVMVEWVDAMGDNGWRPFHEAVKDEPVPCFTFGVVINQTEQSLIIAPSGHMDMCRVTDTLTIPAAWVLKITPLGVMSDGTV